MKKPDSFLIPAVLVALIVTVLVAISCGKSNNGHPTLSLVSINTTVLAQDSLRATFKFTDGNAISNGFLAWIRTRINQGPALYPSGLDTFGYQLPSFSANTGEIYLSLPWNGYLSSGSPENDTLVFKFFLANAADSALSDTVTVPQIVVNFQ
jgi:hypothetical protein